MKKLYSMLLRLLTAISFPFTALILHNSRRVRVVILAEDYILLQRTSMGSQKWSLPGGGVHKSETDEQAVVREVAEEVGLNLHKEQITLLGEDYRTGSGRKKWPRFARAYFLVRLPKKLEPNIRRPLEILEAQWFPLSDLPKEENETLDTALRLLSTL